jgi:putative ABC transport system substrate-binding protein
LAASYVDRILRGDKPADLLLQAATKLGTIVNLKSAKALGLAMPPGLLVAADEVIEERAIGMSARPQRPDHFGAAPN